MSTIDPNSSIQSALLSRIEAMRPKNISIVNELAEVLDISTDSVYRRMRGETHLSIIETAILCNHYKISFDSLAFDELQMVSFTYDDYSQTLESFINYFVGLSNELHRLVLSPAEKKHITYLGDNIPILIYFNSPHLGPFKLYYWINYLTNNEAFKGLKFQTELITSQIMNAAKMISDDYNQMPSTEVWTDSTVVGVIDQIKFYWNTGKFQSKEDALVVLQEMSELMDKIEKQSERGKKLYVDGDTLREGADYHFYYSEIEFENTTIHVELDDMQMVYLGHLSHRYLKSSDKKYAETIKVWFNNIKRRSNLLSESSAAMRYQFFRRCQEKISHLMDEIAG